MECIYIINTTQRIGFLWNSAMQLFIFIFKTVSYSFILGEVIPIRTCWGADTGRSICILWCAAPVLSHVKSTANPTAPVIIQAMIIPKLMRYYKGSDMGKMIKLVKYSTNNDLIFKNVPCKIEFWLLAFPNTYLHRMFLSLHCILVRVRLLSLQQLTPLINLSNATLFCDFAMKSAINVINYRPTSQVEYR